MNFVRWMVEEPLHTTKWLLVWKNSFLRVFPPSSSPLWSTDKRSKSRFLIISHRDRWRATHTRVAAVSPITTVQVTRSISTRNNYQSFSHFRPMSLGFFPWTHFRCFFWIYLFYRGPEPKNTKLVSSKLLANVHLDIDKSETPATTALVLVARGTHSS